METSIDAAMLKLPSAIVRGIDGGLEAVIHFKFTGEQAGEWNAVIRDGNCEVARGIPQRKPSLTVTADSTDFLRILAGELDGLQAYMGGQVKVAGDLNLGTRLIELLGRR